MAFDQLALNFLINNCLTLSRYQSFFQIPLNVITHGLAFHQELARDPELPYNEECFNQIRVAVNERAIVLSNAAEDNGAAAVSYTFRGVLYTNRGRTKMHSLSNP